MFWRCTKPTNSFLQIIACFAVSWVFCSGWQPRSLPAQRSGALCCGHPSCWKGYLWISDRWRHTAERYLCSVRFGDAGLWGQGEIMVLFQLRVCGNMLCAEQLVEGSNCPRFFLPRERRDRFKNITGVSAFLAAW